jgi:hypothetical protein
MQTTQESHYRLISDINKHRTFGTGARVPLCRMLNPAVECVISTGCPSPGCFPCWQQQHHDSTRQCIQQAKIYRKSVPEFSDTAIAQLHLR